ncbi:hypothetical protein ACQ4WX_19200 [Streptomyces lasalocidi]
MTRALPNAAEMPTGAVTNDVRTAAEGVKQSGIVKTPVFGGTLPNPLDGKPPAQLPAKLPVVK